MTDRRLLAPTELLYAALTIWRERSMTTPAGNATNLPSPAGQIGMAAAVSIGIGGMVGAGIFSILGVVAQAAGNAMWLAFAIGGVVALLSTYSYAKLGATFPVGRRRRALPGEELRRRRSGRRAQPVHVGRLHHLARPLRRSLRQLCRNFRDHGASPLLVKSLAIGAVLVLTVVNAFGAQIMGRSETVIVAVKVAILVRVCGGGSMVHQARQPCPPSFGPRRKAILFGAGVLFIGYEGFGLVTNAARDMRDPQDDAAARALHQRDPGDRHLSRRRGDGQRQPDERADRARRDYALAEAAKPFLGDFGFRLIAIAALFSTASAINATLFGSANVCYMIARDGELPARLSRTAWKQATGGLLLTAGLVVAMTLSFDLSGIAMMGSAAFLLVYAAVNAGHLRVLKQTGANAVIVWLSLITCLAMFAVLGVYTWQQQPRAIAALVIIAAASFAAEWAYRRWTGRTIKPPA